MKIQLISLSDLETFMFYSSKYKIFKDSFSPDLMGLEFRGLSKRTAEKIHKLILNDGRLCYKNGEDSNCNLFVLGSIQNFKYLSKKILSDADEDLGYKINRVINNYENYNEISYKIENRDFNFSKPYVMGILNVTPDSFSDGGKYNLIDKAIEHGIELLNSGADILDIGGESTRPGSDPVSADEEIERTICVIEKIKALQPEAIISIDTTKSIVAEKALKSGASIVNDISGGTFDNKIFEAVKKNNAAYVIMHIKGNPKTMQKNPNYENTVLEVFDFLSEQTNKAVKAGIKKIIIDPGIGFGKRIEDNFQLLKRLADFKCLGFPILTGVSRKSFIGKTLNLEVECRDFSSGVLDALAIKNGARIIRTHSSFYGSQVCKLAEKFI